MPFVTLCGHLQPNDGSTVDLRCSIRAVPGRPRTISRSGLLFGSSVVSTQVAVHGAGRTRAWFDRHLAHQVSGLASHHGSATPAHIRQLLPQSARATGSLSSARTRLAGSSEWIALPLGTVLLLVGRSARLAYTRHGLFLTLALSRRAGLPVPDPIFARLRPAVRSGLQVIRR
jgi:hypothetical protein